MTVPTASATKLSRRSDTGWWRTFGHIGSGELISGIAGSPLDHHSAPYLITSEFVSVYRMHPLLPDDYQIRSHENDAIVAETNLDLIQGHGTRPAIDEHGMSEGIYSFGLATSARSPSTTIRTHCATIPGSTATASISERSTSCATASAECRVTTTSARSCASGA